MCASTRVASRCVHRRARRPDARVDARINPGVLLDACVDARVDASPSARWRLAAPQLPAGCIDLFLSVVPPSSDRAEMEIRICRLYSQRRPK